MAPFSSSNTIVSSSLHFLASELDTYLKQGFGLPPTDVWVALSGYGSMNGTPGTGLINKVSVTLVNLEQEVALRSLLPDRSGEVPRLNPAMGLNLLVLFAASFEDYDESLKFVSSTLAFFQEHPVFNAQTSPGLPKGIERLVAELEVTTFQDWSYLWGMLGSTYRPGVVYKIRMVAV